MLYFDMVNLSVNKQLDIVMPNTNKALAVVLEQATPKELATLSKDKDLKSIMDSILKNSAQNSSSDKTLLNLAKNNPTLKDLGNVSSTIKDLINTIKLDKNPLPVETTLKNFLVDIKDLSEPLLKQKLENSGIFLESKLKNVQNPQLELKSLLAALDKSIAKSDIFTVKVLREKISELLNNPALKDASNAALTQNLKDDPNALKQLSKGVSNILATLQEQIKGGDAINSKNVAAQLSKLEHLLDPKLLSAENFKLSSIKDSLNRLSTQLSQSKNPEAKSLLDSIIKILGSLKSIEQNSLNAFLDKKMPQELRNLTESLKGLINKSDAVFSKETTSLTDKLTHFSNPQKLATQENVKDILSQDLKAILSKAGEEISKSSHPHQADLLKQIDKLALQVDYYQLVSHLSNSSSLYLPFSWDSLEEGNINLKKDKDDKFYCDIDLKLKEYGELKLKMVLYEKNQLNIQIYSNSAELKDIIKENVGMLRSALIENEITPREIRLFNTIKKSVTSPYESSYKDIDMGFEVKA